MSKIVAQGAEALIREKGNTITKDRVKKSYRLPILDNKLRKQRTKSEVRLIDKLSSNIPVPQVISSSEYQIVLERIKGKKLSQYLDKLKNKDKIAKLIGINTARMHDLNIIHGDLTTSNMIYSKSKIFFIDFGLGFSSSRAEDKAVDLHVLKEALEAKHYKFADKLWQIILNSYKKTSIHSDLTLKQLEKVESRGRYKEQY